jgi:WD40 repeat protein
VIRRFKGHAGGVTSVAFGSDGTVALSGSDDATLILWDVATGEPIRWFEGHGDGVNVVTYGPDGKTALSGSDSGALILWDVATGEKLRQFEGHTSAVTGAVFHPDGLTILSLGKDLSLRSWNLETGEEEDRHTFGGVPASLAITPDGDTAFVSVLADITLWDIGRWQENGRLTGHKIGADRSGTIQSISISPNGLSALSAGFDGTVRVWNLEGQTVHRRFPTDGTSIEAVAVDSDGSRLLTGQGTGETALWDVERREIIRRYAGEGIPVAPDCAVFSPPTPESTGETSALVCSEDVNSPSGATSLVLWDLETGREVRRFEGHVTLIRAVAFSPDGRSALAGSQGVPDASMGDLILWDLETGREIRRFDITHDVADIAVSADGDRALTGSVTDSVAILWDVATGREVRRFVGHTHPVLNVALGPDEETVLTASVDGSLILWDIETGDVIRRFTGHRTAVWGLDISADGQYAVTGSEYGTVILWDIATGQELRRFAAHNGRVYDVAFAPDGQTFYSVGEDGLLIEWQVTDSSLDELVEWIHANRYARELTCEEQTQFRIEPSTCEKTQASS